MFKSLELKSSLYFSCVLALALLALISLTVSVFEQYSFSAVSARLSSMTLERKLAILTYLDFESTRVKEISRRNDLGELLNDFEKKRISSSQFRYRSEKLLKRILNSASQFESLAVINSKGMIIASTNEKAVGRNVSLSQQHGNHAKEFSFRITEERLLSMRIPIKYAEKKLAFLLVERTLDSLAAIVRGSNGLGEHATFFFGTDSQLILTSNLKLSVEKISPWWLQMQSTHQSREDTFRSSDFRGLPVFLRASQLTPGNWRLLLQLDQEHALYNFSSVRNSLIAATCGVGLLAVLLNVMIAKGLFAPVTPILVTLKNLSEGFLYSRASVGRKDQFGQFATELNRLAESYENEVTENRGLAQEIELLRSERKETAQTFLINENRRVTELKPKHTPVNLNDVISEACDRIVPLCDLKNVEFEIILDNDGLSLEIDQQQIQSMLIDLLRRAVEGSDEFSTIVLKTHIKDGRLQLLIKDWGAVEQAPYPMLERYREVLQQQDAELHFNSRVGVGNTIFIEFPKERSIGRQANFYA